MGNRIEIWINQAEKTWLDLLFSHAEKLYTFTFLPSHDHTHHRRVWNICKSLLREIDTFNSDLDQTLVEGALIAAFFHDLGMVYSTREDHGKLGRELCEQWFSEHSTESPSRFGELLEAIEQHDLKEAKIYSSISPEAPPGILSILSVADDLEALGTIGVYRYAEIYLKRGTGLKDLGYRILENAGTRFENLSNSCAHCNHIIKIYQQQFDNLSRFYEKYNSQISQEFRPHEIFAGQLGIVNYIRVIGLGEQTRPEDLLHRIVSNETDRLVTDYFKNLINELEQARK